MNHFSGKMPSCSGNSSPGPLNDECALKLADRTEDVKEKLPGRSTRVDRLIQNHEIDTEAIKFLGQGGKVSHAATFRPSARRRSRLLRSMRKPCRS